MLETLERNRRKRRFDELKKRSGNEDLELDLEDENDEHNLDEDEVIS